MMAQSAQVCVRPIRTSAGHSQHGSVCIFSGMDNVTAHNRKEYRDSNDHVIQNTQNIRNDTDPDNQLPATLHMVPGPDRVEEI